jgi:MFS family permease
VTAVGIDRVAVQRRTVRVMRLAQVPGQAAIAGSVAVSALLAKDLLGSDRWAGLASAAFTLGAACTAVPLAVQMRRRGRRLPLVTALAVAAGGSVVAAVGGQQRWFVLFLIGMFLFGAGQASSLQGRYVAADLAVADERPKLIAAIVWVGTLGAVFGPMLTPFEKAVGRRLGLDELVGPYLFGTALFVTGAVIVFTMLRPDPLEVAGGVDPSAERTRPLRQLRASYAGIRSSTDASLGLAAMAVSQAAMVAVMTMTPSHMKDHGHADLSAFVIALHIVGMFGLAPMVGRFVERVGSTRAIALGSIVLGAGTITTVMAGYVPVLMFVGLFLLGLGWNIGLIGGSTLLTGSVPSHQRVEVQGTGDLTMSLCGAVAALSSGFVKQSWGFHLLADAAALLAAGLLVATWIARATTVRAVTGS